MSLHFIGVKAFEKLNYQSGGHYGFRYGEKARDYC